MSSIFISFFRHFFPYGEGMSEVSEKCCNRTWKAVASRSEVGCITGFIHYNIPRSTDLETSRVSVSARFVGQGEINTKKVDFRVLEDYKGIVPFNFPSHEIQEYRDYQLTFELRIGVKLVVKKKTRDFSVAKSRFEDVVLKVEQQRFHVSRTVLASFSSYFAVLFFGPFRESKQHEIELKGIYAETFQDLLQVIYHCPSVNEDNVEDLLEMARMYDVQPVTDHCIKFVKGPNDLTAEEKMRLTREYEQLIN